MSELVPPEVLAGARNLVSGWSDIQPGQKVLILAEISADVEPRTIAVLAAECERIGAETQVLWTRRLLKSWWENVPDVVVAAYEAADLVLHSHFSIGRAHKPIHNAIMNGTTRVRNYATSYAILGSDWARFPLALYDEVDSRLIAALRGAATFRVTTPLGTDVSGKLVGSLKHFDGVKIRRQGRNRPFPPGPHIPMKAADASGVIVFTNTYPWGARLWGLPEMRFDEPVRLTVEAGRITHIAGGREADAVKRAFEYIATKAQVGDDAYRFDGFHTGVHHKAFCPVPGSTDPDLWWHLMHHHPGMFHFHLGGDPDRDYGTQFMTHISATTFDATLFLDGERTYDAGRLLLWRDPEIRRLAADCGDADELLAEKAFTF